MMVAVLYFRPDELTLFLKPEGDAGTNENIGKAAMDDLAKLLPGDLFNPDPDKAFRGRSGARKLSRTPDGMFVTQTVNLAGWTEILPPGDQQDKLIEPVQRVTKAVRRLNQEINEKIQVHATTRLLDKLTMQGERPKLGSYRLHAASPNWLALPLDS